jgi:pimeloyl-ACP methyl ester carboxylesterase
LPQTPIHLTDWRRLGESDPTLVLIHGSAQGSRIGGDHHFSAQSRLAMRGWRMLVPDRPGHGRSPAPGRPDDPQADGAWVAELLGDGAHLVGHSFGGCVALAAAGMRPEAVRSLTLIEPALQNLIPNDPDIQARAAQLGQIFATAKSPADIAAGFLRWAGIPSDLRGAADPAEMEHLGQGLRQIKLPSEADIRAALAVVRQAGIPLLTVSAGWSPGIDAVARAVAKEGGGRYVHIPAEHHFPHLVSDAFNDLLDTSMRAADARVSA